VWVRRPCEGLSVKFQDWVGWDGAGEVAECGVDGGFRAGRVYEVMKVLQRAELCKELICVLCV
jgi:hypothetical protein